MKKYLYPLLLILVAGILGTTALWKSHEQPVTSVAEVPIAMNTDTAPASTSASRAAQAAPAPARKPAPGTGTTQPADSGKLTSGQVATHNSAQSCWTSISGNVYDLTSWINQHPGGRGAILRMCGTDGTAAFDAQHGGQGRPERELAQFKIGPLAN